jgi:hypothetical protein
VAEEIIASHVVGMCLGCAFQLGIQRVGWQIVLFTIGVNGVDRFSLFGAATKAELSSSAAEGVLVLVTVLFVAAAVEVEVMVGVEVTVFVTLMITHRRESLSICMIKPAGFLMTKLPR